MKCIRCDKQGKISPCLKCRDKEYNNFINKEPPKQFSTDKPVNGKKCWYCKKFVSFNYLAWVYVKSKNTPQPIHTKCKSIRREEIRKAFKTGRWTEYSKKYN